VAQIAAANCLSSADVILAGQALWLPHLCAPPPTSSPRIVATDTPGIPSPIPPGPGPSILNVSPEEVAPGQEVLFTFSNFTPNGLLTVDFSIDASGEKLPAWTFQVRMNERGEGGRLYIIPGDAPLGRLLVTAVDPTPWKNQQAYINITTPATEPPTATATITTEATAISTGTPSETPTLVPTVEPTLSPTTTPTP
jgi:hypothetical protein